MRAAIYARFSSEMQSERSVADQTELCRSHAAQIGAAVTETFEDRAISGASITRRPGLLALMQSAEAGSFDIVICEALDRLSRDQEDIAHIFKRLAFHGTGIRTVAEGDVTALHIGLKGTMNALFLADLAAKTKRGQAGRVRAGRIPGGLCYGYEVVREGDERGLRCIVEAEAEIIRRIFREYAEGASPRKIVGRLNKEGIPGPRGNTWSASTVIGSRARRNGIINNELYAGRIVYNRQRFIKDPSTGRRQPRLNPESEWIVQEAPELRIVAEALWKAAQSARGEYAARGPRAMRPRHLLSGLLKCSHCGENYIVAYPGRLACSSRMNRGTCDNTRVVTREHIERRVVESIRRHLLSPKVIEAAIVEYRAEAERARKKANASRGRIEREIGELGRKIERAVDALIDGDASPALKARLAELEARRKELTESLDAKPSPVVELHPNAARHYAAIVENLSEALQGDDAAEAIREIRALIQKIDVIPDGPRKPVKLVLHGNLASLLSPEGTQCMGPMVAGARNKREPAFRLSA